MGNSSLTPELYELILKIIDERVKEIKVTREEYEKLAKSVNELTVSVRELSERVNELIEAHKKAEERITKLEIAVANLVEANRKAEERITRLENAVAKLETTVANLVEITKRLDERVTKLEDAVATLIEVNKRFDERITKLEEAVITLTRSVKNLSETVAGLGETIGFGLEDIGRVVLPSWIERHLGIKVNEFERKFFFIDNEMIEVNLYAEGVLNNEKIIVLVESKSRIHRSDVKDFSEKIDKIKKVIPTKMVGILFGYVIYPDAAEEAQKRGLYTVASYQR